MFGTQRILLRYIWISNVALHNDHVPVCALFALTGSITICTTLKARPRHFTKTVALLRAFLHEFFGHSINSTVSPSRDKSMFSVYVVLILRINSLVQWQQTSKHYILWGCYYCRQIGYSCTWCISRVHTNINQWLLHKWRWDSQIRITLTLLPRILWGRLAQTLDQESRFPVSLGEHRELYLKLNADLPPNPYLITIHDDTLSWTPSLFTTFGGPMLLTFTPSTMGARVGHHQLVA
jgi:hypothetical protein